MKKGEGGSTSQPSFLNIGSHSREPKPISNVCEDEDGVATKESMVEFCSDPQVSA